MRISSNSTSATEARMVVVRSVRICTFTAGGTEAWSWGSRSLMRSTTAMMLAPGWRWMFRITAGVVFIQAACWTFSDAVDHRGHVREADRRAVADRRRRAAGTRRW